jgi:hypothetical protein
VALRCDRQQYAVFIVKRFVEHLAALKHDPEKCVAVFRKDHAQSKS